MKQPSDLNFNIKNWLVHFYENINIPVLLLNRDIRIISLNHAAAGLLQKVSNPDSDQNNSNMVHPLPWLSEDFKTFFKDSQTSCRIEKTLTTLEGQKYFVIDFIKMDNFNDQSMGAIVIINDITKQKLVERRLKAQYDITSILAESPTINDAIPKFLKSICTTVEWNYGEMWQVDTINHELVWSGCWYGKKSNYQDFIDFSRTISFKEGVGLPGLVWKTRNPIWVSDVTVDKKFIRATIAVKAGLHGAFAIPLQTKDVFLGVMVFFNREIQPPDYSVLEMFNALGNQIGSFLIRKQAEENKYRFQSIIENSDDAIYSKTLDGNIASWNAGAKRIYGYSDDEIIGKPASILAPKESANEILNILKRIKKGETVEHYETVRLRKNGKRINVSLTISPIKDTKGTIIEASTIARDITEKKLAEDALRKSEDFLSNIINNSTAVIYVKNSDGRYMLVNNSWEKVFNASRHHVAGKTDSDLFPKDIAETFRSHDLLVLKSNRTLEVEEQITQEDGVHTFFSIKFPLFDEKDQPYAICGISTDITDRKITEGALRLAKYEAEKANRAKSVFLANMSHEIRTPLNSITGFGHLLMQTELNAKQRDYLNKIQSSAHSLLAIINDILDFSKIEAGKLELESTAFRLDDALDSISNLLSLKAAEKNIEMMFYVAPEIPETLIGDPLRLGQVLINLLNNAIKFTDTGEIILSVHIADELAGADKLKLQFVIRDTGIGMTKDQLAKLFRPFTQADGSTTRKYGGTGLGLTISKRLVTLMGGEIWAHSEVGVGSTFTFTAVFDRAASVKPKRYNTTADLKNLRALVVDDNASSRTILKTILESFSFRVTAVVSGQKAIEELGNTDGSKDPYQLVLIDWKMPEADGLETAKQIKKNDQYPVPIIIMVTAFGREELREQAEELGLAALLTKPVLPSMLFDTIMSVFSKDIKKCAQNNKAARKRQNLNTLIGKRILLVEDNSINRQVAKEILESAGIMVETAENGLEAVKKIEQSVFPYDAVLMDIQMPKMDGFQATRLIRKKLRYIDLPIIAMTANAMKSDRELCITVGMNDHIAKPIDINHMFNVLIKWLKPGTKEHYPSDQTNELTNSGSNVSFSLPGIDYSSALKRIGGNHDLFKKLLQSFISDYASFGQEIRVNIGNGDYNRARQLSHTLKGVAGNIGAVKLYETAKAVEASIKMGDRDKCFLNINELDKSLQTVIISIKTYLKSAANTPEQTKPAALEQGPLSMAVAEPLLLDFKTLLNKNSLSAAKKLVSIKMLFYGTEYQPYLDRIDTAVNTLDFRTALQHLEALLKELKRTNQIVG